VRAVDLFAGPGGWDLAAAALGVDVTGVELDDAACATRRAAGLRTVQGDVAELDPAAFGPVELLIGSPPCPTFSSAGKGSGRDDMDLILRWVPRVAAGEPLTELGAAVDDARSALVLEPLRMIVATRPTWVALEQVPPCLPIWRAVALALEGLGYRTWTGILEAERYGVPQTRERAILLARRDGRPCHPPAPTHQRYVPGEPRLAAPQLTLDGEVLPWVSMADALGWGMTARPSVSVAGRNDRGGPRSLDGGSGARETLRRAAERAVDEPAPTITGGHDTANRVWLDRRQGDAPPRSEDEPAHTMSSSGLAKGRDVWTRDRPATSHDTANRVWLQKRDGRAERVAAGAGNQPRPADAPAPTIDSGVRQAEWTSDRSATTVAGARSEDGGTVRPGADRETTAAVRVTVEEAAALQSFPPGYPWSGSKSKQYQQIGNAVPPLLALHVLAALLDIDPTTAVAVEDAA
jgi:DNA (cytosine-5)-methyltransferase 1